ncbi:NAD(P)-dependent oxidoreductase [Chelatococcus sp. GCM10030263]|uniref:NAD(P)-dependent oxidoreductase n=1 Tax=Chelatococcus sp. GCM10030263 TaxID=3273387 RepID=UPI00361179CC
MKIFMIGEAANHKDKLAAKLPSTYEFVALPREAAQAPSFDNQIGPEDVVISLRFSRKTSPAPSFRLLHVPGAGLDGIDFNTLPAASTVCNVFEHEIPIAEYVCLAMLQWEIRLDEMRQSFTPQSWSDVYRSRVPHGELFGRTLGIIGFGRIGRAIAARARAFGMRIVALDAATEVPPGLADQLLSPGNLPELLGQADYIAIACPLTEETRGLFGAAEFRAMKTSAVVINISRAEILAEAALYEALRDGVIGGACLDVWYRYPAGADDQVPPANLPFHDLPNVIATPHSSAWTANLPGRRYSFIAENLKRLAAGEPLLNVVRRPLA